MLREDDIRPTAIVSIAYDAEERRRDGGAIAKTPVNDLRSSLEALAPEDGALLRAIRRPLAIKNVGPQRLGNLVIDEDGLTIPHPRFRERLFVLEPLAEISPALVDPVTGSTIAQLLGGVRP